ncbi:DUF58 domain-containing protein [Virgibacillus sp. NKC19-16]|uniref:DUF58 domain-containing protein n=1 Tax=Virgibacillus salidurans TaxID=2831673 RepID=UPI001F266211|nr:DUF58 domain-containing protein [Virgibacillus sp. NKC19-16]UJL47219.1 DUF58 domain-containing protein [Virgibacillus sp. NKC19-16]
MKDSLRFLGNLMFILFLFLLLFSFAMFQGGFTSWFLFYSFLPIFLYHLGLLLYPIRNWKVTRNLSRRVIRAGDGVHATIRIERAIPFPLYYCICEEIFPDTLNKEDNRECKYRYMVESNKFVLRRKMKEVIFPSMKRVIEIPYQIQHVPRGEHQLTKIRIRTGDVFGFVKREHTFDVSDQLVAYPNVRPINMAEKISSFEQGSTASYTLNLKNTNVASGIREYMPGDKFSWIDWKQTARKNEVMTKEFEQEKSTDILLVLDSCYYEGMNLIAFEAAVEVTVSLMETIRKQSTAVGLLSIGEEVAHFPVHHDPNQGDFMLQHLSRIQPKSSQPFAVKLKEELFKMDSGNVVMVITSRMDNGFKETIQKLKQRSKKVIILFIQSSKVISQNEQMLIEQLQFSGVGIHILTENELMENPIEVSGI